MIETAVLITVIVTSTTVPLIAYIIRACYGSKCTEVKIDKSGITIKRDPKQENKELPSFRLPTIMSK